MGRTRLIWYRFLAFKRAYINNEQNLDETQVKSTYNYDCHRNVASVMSVLKSCQFIEAICQYASYLLDVV
jgi:hypothetical protein